MRWSLTLREECRLRFFENRALMKIYVPVRKTIEEDGRKMHTEELHNLFSSPCITRVTKWRRMRYAGHVARMKEKRNAHRVLLGKRK
jgi:hypothetical protein